VADVTFPRTIRAPWAARLQADTGPADVALTERAQLLHPAVRWWWGVRPAGPGVVAQCYLCERPCATWASSWPMPARARDDILDHRDWHVVAGHASIGTDAPGMSPGADARSGESR